MKSFLISYYYLATGMEGRADEYPATVIIASSKEMAAYFYNVLFFEPYKDISFASFQLKHESDKYWGLSIKELSTETVDKPIDIM